MMLHLAKQSSRGLRLAALLAMLGLATAACGGQSDETTAGDPSPAGSSGEQPSQPPLGAALGEPIEPADADWGDLPFVDQQLFTMLAEIDETFRNQAAEVWSDQFRLDQMPLAIAYRDASGQVGKVYLLHHPDAASLPGATKVSLDSSLGLGEVYQVDPPPSVQKLGQSVPFDFNVLIGQTGSMLFFLQEGDPVMWPSTWDFARLVVHESFHRYQLFWGTPSRDSTPYPRTSRVNAELAALETRILAAAIAGEDHGEIRQRLQQFLAARDTRTATHDLGNLEHVQEANEGTARYVGNRYAEVNSRPGRWDAPTGQLDNIWLELIRFYNTGSQLGWILDALGVEWKDQVAAGTSLVELARQAVEPADTATLLAAAKLELGYEDIVAQVAAANLSSADPLAGLPGFPEGAAETGSLQGSTPIDIQDMIDCLTAAGIDIPDGNLTLIDWDSYEIQAITADCDFSSP